MMSVDSAERLGRFGRMSLFLRQVIFELKKVVWPTREQLITYTAVVIVFVTIMGLIIVCRLNGRIELLVIFCDR